MLPEAFWRDFGSAPLLDAIAKSVASLPAKPGSLAVALSGGADSAMLAVHAALYGRRHSVPVHCLHIHHGLQAPADRWQAHAHDLAQMLELSCHSLTVSVALSGGDGMESAARDARYRGLARLAGQIGVRHILLAHHRGDQAETVLLRLLRGAGPGGLAAMAPLSYRHDLADLAGQSQSLCYMRPWLDVDRSLLLAQADAFAAITGWSPVQDPTNADDRYTRAAVRERLVPELDQRWPGWQANLARHARQSAEIDSILQEVAEQDFATLDPEPDDSGFSLAAWRRLSPARQALVLRYWLARAGLRMPTDARLQDWMRQLRGLHALGHDRQMRVKHGSVWVRCVKGRVFLDRGLAGR